MHIKTVVIALSAVALATSGACGTPDKATPGAADTAKAPATAAAAGAVQPGPGGKIITVELITDATGNFFKPKELNAHKGDVIRYTLTQGVHNVDFLPDSNAGKSGLPKPSDMLQLPGQTYDVLVNWDKGTYYFQCTPHAALGMHGHVQVD